MVTESSAASCTHPQPPAPAHSPSRRTNLHAALLLLLAAHEPGLVDARGGGAAQLGAPVPDVVALRVCMCVGLGVCACFGHVFWPVRLCGLVPGDEHDLDEEW